MSECKRTATLRSVYREMDEDRRKKLEFLALELLDAQMIVEQERTVVGESKNQDASEGVKP